FRYGTLAAPLSAPAAQPRRRGKANHRLCRGLPGVFSSLGFVPALAGARAGLARLVETRSQAARPQLVLVVALGRRHVAVPDLSRLCHYRANLRLRHVPRRSDCPADVDIRPTGEIRGPKRTTTANGPAGCRVGGISGSRSY